MLYPEYLPNQNQHEPLPVIYLADEEETQQTNKQTKANDRQEKEIITPLITDLELLMRPA
ncbi:hypothetical protein [Oscillatoria salina]|uniref:hypothetical protein n=1 Tax=Oscillatoria salina TaxID=331517 RepID=UPI0013BCE07C|nr:hypothetical protein [Oscillatoria salina]MBZ8181560.1 hypothetical protein [Oscillatoria salina IIICB1]NET89537.1 hypothetical protein [Kamptonema sp. SIO1D9]